MSSSENSEQNGAANPKQAIQLYLKSLEEQKALIARWQETTGKTEPGGADQPATAPESKSGGKEKTKLESEVRPQ